MRNSEWMIEKTLGVFIMREVKHWKWRDIVEFLQILKSQLNTALSNLMAQL